MKTVSASISKLLPVLICIALFGTPMMAGGASLWTSARTSEKSMWGDRRAARVGDILTVIIQESARVQASVRTETDKSASIDSAVDSFFFPSSNLGTHNGELPEISMTGSNDFSGGGAITNSQSVSARAAVTVIDVLPNGNLVIEGSRYVAYSEEKQYAILRGIIRPDDIQTGNTILSSSIADARVEFISRGAISSAQRKGWLTRLFDTINPF
ncbi:MAG: flagellar basal body L-ring protein FlgH [Verrucomicrobia bacterium]|nr:MAG: flagellar basal body L-ring protein FlgH [Verrucomicrobiota bacterium]